MCVQATGGVGTLCVCLSYWCRGTLCVCLSYRGTLCVYKLLVELRHGVCSIRLSSGDMLKGFVSDSFTVCSFSLFRQTMLKRIVYTFLIDV